MMADIAKVRVEFPRDGIDEIIEAVRETAWERTPEVRVRLEAGAYLPERAHGTDAGADIRTPRRVKIAAHGTAIVRTGVHVELPPNTVGMLKSKSGLNVRSGIVGEGVIDEGYDGEIVVKLYNNGEFGVLFDKGDKIIQLVVMPVLYPRFVEADEIGGGERGSDGFGSTGR